MVRHWSVAVVLCVVGGMMWTGLRGWEQHPISCDFQGNECGWTNDENMTLSWTRERIWKLLKYDYFMALEMDDAEVNNTGRLSSPWLNGSDSQTCLLKFYRHIKTTHRACQLSVLLRTDTNLTSLWDTVDATGLISKPSINISVPCSENRFQIVYEGKKLKRESCGGSVDVDDIEFKVQKHELSSPSPTTPLQTTIVTTGRTDTPDINDKTSQNVTDHRDAYSAKDRLSSAVIAAVIAAVLLVVILFFLRRKAQNQGKADHWVLNMCKKRSKWQSPRSPGASAAFANSHDIPDNIQQHANPESEDTAGIQDGGHRASVHLYSLPDYSGDEHRYSTVDNHHYGTLDDHRDEHRYSTLDGQRKIPPDNVNCITPVDDVNDGYEIPSHSHTTDKRDGACTSNHNFYNT